jgi:hypothetical protein
MVAIADEAVVDRHQKSIDLGRTHFGSSDLACRLAVDPTSSQARRSRISLSTLQSGTGTRAERLSGWIIPVAKERGSIMFYREPAHEI